MTHEEKQRILKDALDRAYLGLDTHADPASENFAQLLRNITELEFSLGAQTNAELLADGPRAPREEGLTFTMEPTRTENEQPEPAETAENEETGEPETPAEPKPGTEEPAYKMEDVRGALAAARRKGVNVAEIIRSFGVDNFTIIDKSKYPEIMEKLKAEGAV